MPIRKIVATIEPVQEGTGDPSPDNVRPISGWTGVNIFDNNKNLYSTEKTTTHRGLTYTTDGKGHLDITGTYSGGTAMSAAVGTSQTANYQSGMTLQNEMLLKPGTYTLKATRTGAGFALTVLVGPTLGTAYNETHFLFDALTGGTFTITTPEYLSLYTTASELTAQSYTVHYDIQLETGDHATTFEEREYASLPINWESEAGTVYGGTVTLNEDGSADVASNRVITVLDGSGDEDWSNGGYGAPVKWWIPTNLRNLIVIPGQSTPIKAIANYLRPLSKNSDWNTNDNYFSHATGYLYMKCSTIGAYANWRNYLSENPLTILFKLKTPITHHFSDIGQLKTFLGVNNVWCNTGDITELVYPVDTTAAIDAGDAENASAISTLSGSLATVETTSTASKVYAVGDLLVYNNQLYKVASAIAAGGALTPGTNITAVTVESELDGKQDAPTNAGTAGQVLGLDESLSAKWIDKSDVDFYNALPLRLILPKMMQSPNYSSRSILVTYNKIVLSWTGSNNQNSAKISVKSGRGTYQNLSSETLSEMQVDDFFVLPNALKTTRFSIKALYLPGPSTGNGMNIYFCYANIVDNVITVTHTHKTSLTSSNFSMDEYTIPMYSDSTHLAIFIGTGGTNRRGTIYLWTELNT